MTNKSNLEDTSEIDNEEFDHEGFPLGLDEMLIKTQRNFRTGNEEVNKYDSTPGEYLKEYNDFN